MCLVLHLRHSGKKQPVFLMVESVITEYLSDWLVSVSASRVKGTIERYHWLIKNVVVPVLGNYKLKDITPDLLQNFYNLKLKEGKSADMVRSTHKVLSVAFTHAIHLGMIGKNPCQATDPPKPETKEMQILDEDQIQVLLSNAMRAKDVFYPIYYLAIHTGMRQGELVGLMWKDIDWINRHIQVRRQVVRYLNGAITKPKSKAETA